MSIKNLIEQIVEGGREQAMGPFTSGERQELSPVWLLPVGTVLLAAIYICANS